MYALFAFHWGAETSSYSLFLRDYFHLSKFQSGQYISFPAFFLAIGAFVAGWRLQFRRYSFGRVAALAFVVSSLGQVLMVVPNLYCSIAMRFLHETGDGIVATLILTEISALFEIDRIGGLSSLVSLSGILAQSLGILVFSIIGDIWGHQYSMLLAGLTTLLPVFPALRFFNISSES
jgi:MFS family permease